MMKPLAKCIAAVAAVSFTISAMAAPSPSKPSSVAASAMQCYTLYSMLMEESPADPYRNNVLGSQAMLMGTIYVFNASTPSKKIDKEAFERARQVSEAALLSAARVSREPIVDRLISCEGWREELLTALALGKENFGDAMTEADARRIMSSIPAPKGSYPLKGATRTQLNLVVDEALSKRMARAGSGQ